MLCQKCNKKVATVFVSAIVNGKNNQMYLCADCAKEFHESMTANAANMPIPFSIDDILSNMGINEESIKEIFGDLKGIDIEFGIGGLPNDIMQSLNAQNAPVSPIKEQISENVENTVKENNTEYEDIKCDVCNTSFADYNKSGKLGCSNCYSAFEDKLKDMIESIYGYSEHIGKAPGHEIVQDEKSKAIDELRRELNLAIEQEEYEQAAILRDKILELESDNI